jgi:hypothetical protein
VQALCPVDLGVEEGVEEVETGDPARDRAAERPRLPGQVATNRDPCPHRGEPIDGAEPKVGEPGDALEVRVYDKAGHRNRPEPAADRVELPDGNQEDRQ